MEMSQKEQEPEQSRRGLRGLVGFALATFLVLPGIASAQICSPGSTPNIASVAALCAVPGNVCAAGVATLGGDACVTAGTVLDFTAAGFPTIVVAAGGTLETEDKNVAQSGGCAGDRSSKMTILAGDLTIQSGGTINGDTGIVSGHTMAGQIYIDLDIVGATTGSLVVQPGGDLSADRLGAGNGRGGNITVVAAGLIDVQALPACPHADLTCRGVISANSFESSTLFSFNRGCGQAEIALVAEGTNAADAVTVDGTVEIINGLLQGDHGALGGIIKILGGADISHINSPFSPNPLSPPNPPDNNGRVVVGLTGVVNTDCTDPGGCQIYITACFVLNQGVIQAGGKVDDTGPSAFAREQVLPVIIGITANETIDVNSGGQIIADLRDGFKQHIGQGLTNGLGLGDGCVFVVQAPPGANGPVNASGKAGSDICLVARAGITIDGTNVKFAGLNGIFGNGFGDPNGADDDFAVRARNVTGGQRSGTVLVLSTQEDEIELRGNAITVNAPGVGGRGGEVYAQAAEDVRVIGSSVQITANGPGTGSGGIIGIEAVTGAIIQANGRLEALPGAGVITLRECVANAADNPLSNPAATLLAADCGNAHLVNPVPNLAPCAACSCIDRVRLQGPNVLINGQNLDAVRQVAFTPTCDAASDLASCVVNVPFITQTDTTITVPLPACAVIGDHVVIGSPGLDGILGNADDLSASTSCSRDTFPF